MPKAVGTRKLENNQNIDNIEKYKNAYKADEVEECIHILIQMALYDADNIKKRFLLSNALINPFGYKFDQKEYEKVCTIFITSLNKLKEMSVENDFAYFLKEMCLYTKIFYENNKSNTERLRNNKFFTYSLAEELCMICIFLQDQSRLIQEKVDETIKRNGIVTGMEADTTFFESSYVQGVQSSATDGFESNLEMYDTLIKYLFHLKKDELYEETISFECNKLPYDSPIFEELSIIAYQRTMYLKIEEKYRYMEWNISLRKNQYGENVYLFESTDHEQGMSHTVGINRRQMQFTNNSLMVVFDAEEGLKCIELMAKQLNVNNVDFRFIEKKEYFKATTFFKSIRTAAEKECKPYYLECKIGILEAKDLFDCYEFLNIVGKVYISACLKCFSQYDKLSYKYLAPIINMQMLIETFAKLYDISIGKANAIIREFVYDENTGREEGDIFTRPLIQVNRKSLILCQTLIEQINMSRNIEKALCRYKVNYSNIGKQFEASLIEKLKGNPYVHVNENKIEFEAYDGKNIEFDFIGTMEDYLILIECKSILTPYSDKELYERGERIREGVEQVLRRVDVVQKDWDKIKERASIPLPELPFREEKIIKLVCTDIFDFTTLNIKGVKITDSTTLIKYFNEPYVKKMKINQKRKEMFLITTKALWKEGAPTTKEFISYLDSPSTVVRFKDCIHYHMLPIICFENENCIAIKDLYLDQNPFQEDIDDERRVKSKFYPNEKCPCGSGKKYKKCCGRYI